MPTIDMAATGANIKALIKAKGLKIGDIQNGCGINTPQAIFKWMRGDAIHRQSGYPVAPARCDH